MDNDLADGRQTVTLTVPEALQMRLREIHYPWAWLNDPEYWVALLEDGIAAHLREHEAMIEKLVALEDVREQEK
ncbi:MAG: hypothetical protein WA975_19390 [Mesorhizobium sp.]|jgi:hypothetical protein